MIIIDDDGIMHKVLPVDTLDKIINDLESLREPTEPHLVDYRYHRNDMLDAVLSVIERYRNEVSS